MESGLVGLRAELQKKRDEASRFVPGQRGVAGREKEAAQPKAFSASNAGVSGRAARDEEQRQVEERTEEKTRQALERKAAMYGRLQRGTEVLEDDHLNQKFLVNFQKKIVDDVLEKKKRREEEEEKARQERQQREKTNPDDYAAGSADQEWAEYTDAFGRTRQCLRAELPQRLEQDRQLSRDLHPAEEAEGEAAVGPRLLEDLQREARRHKWEAEEVLNATKKDLHYQDVLYDEARAHGPGFLKFSRDERERKAQMELLRDLRTETQRAEATTVANNAKRQKAMKGRLEKVRQRKRLKMGLPVRDDDRLKTPPGSEDEAEEEDQKVEVAQSPPSPLPKAKVAGKVREWDLGKEGVAASLTQEEWVLRQRSQRTQEFAPPSSYEPRGSRTHSAMSYQTKRTVDIGRESCPSSFPDQEESFREERNPGFAPPATHEYYGPTVTRGRAHHRTPAPSVEAAITRGLAHLRKLSDQ